jgi:hypothetical protein
MYCSKFMCLACVCVLALVAGGANADLIGTYVDADQSNTTPGTAFSVTESDTDNLWHLDASRSYCQNGNVIVAQTDAEDPPMLTTTVSGVANGTYNVYAVYWRHTVDQFWAIDAGLQGGSMLVCDSTGIPTGNSTPDKQQCSMLLGQAIVTSGSFAVNIAERPDASRGWYDGISYQAVPEPSAIAFMVTGLLGLLAYAWRKRKCVPS